MSPFTKEEQRWLLSLARQVIAAAVMGTPLELDAVAARLPSERLRELGAAFITLHQHGRLRGCIGSVRAGKPLYQTVADCAVSAALHDPRFEPVTVEEVPTLEIEISLLSPFFAIQSHKIKPGEHGLMVTQGFQRGLLLPQVAREQHWSREQFLEETCAKAGLERDAWKKGAQLEAFTAFIFSEASFLAEPPPVNSPGRHS